MQYEILNSNSSFSVDGGYEYGADENLEKKVADYIAQGWRPQGGVSTIVLRHNDNTKFTVIQQFQAMIKD